VFEPLTKTKEKEMKVLATNSTAIQNLVTWSTFLEIHGGLANSMGANLQAILAWGGFPNDVGDKMGIAFYNKGAIQVPFNVANVDATFIQNSFPTTCFYFSGADKSGHPGGNVGGGFGGPFSAWGGGDRWLKGLVAGNQAGLDDLYGLVNCLSTGFETNNVTVFHSNGTVDDNLAIILDGSTPEYFIIQTPWTTVGSAAWANVEIHFPGRVLVSNTYIFLP
jgi:hypothetical protein